MNFFLSFASALVAISLSTSLVAAENCEKIKNAKQRLACYDAASHARSENAPNDLKSNNGCRTFETASNTLKLSIEGGVLRNDMLATGIADLIAKREECRLSAKGQSDNVTYERNINAFQDIYQAFLVTEKICRTDRIASVLNNCSVNIVPLSSGGMTYGCNEFYKPIPRHSAWIQGHCGGRDTVASLISYILTEEVTVY